MSARQKVGDFAERENKRDENRRLCEAHETILRCAEAIEFYMGGPKGEGPTTLGKAFHIHECIREIRKALKQVGQCKNE